MWRWTGLWRPDPTALNSFVGSTPRSAQVWFSPCPREMAPVFHSSSQRSTEGKSLLSSSSVSV